MQGLNGFMQRPLLLVFLALTGLILCAALLPQPDIIGFQTSGPFMHASAFIVLAAFASIAWPRSNPFLVMFGLAAFGGAIELLQGAMTFGREADWLDWYQDIKATVATVALISLAKGNLPVLRGPAAEKGRSDIG